VGIPAHDEADRIEVCLRSVLDAARHARLPTALVVVADACTDATAALAQRVLDAADPSNVMGTVVRTNHRAAGAARATALDTALEMLDATPDAVWLATTDADTLVHPSWLRAHLRWARRGVDGIAGLVEVDWEGTPPDLAARYGVSIEPDGVAMGHRHVHGANLGVLGQRWQEVGGCGAGPVAEDHELWRRLRAAGAEVIGVDDLRVRTSGRLAARAPLGFSYYLTQLVADA